MIAPRMFHHDPTGPSPWLDRLRLGAEVLVVSGGALLTVISAYEELQSLRDYRRDLLDDQTRPTGEGEEVHDAANR